MSIDVPALLGRLGIEAKKVGREWLALCPNREHPDTNPSWRMRDEPGHERHGAQHCFACGFGGGPAELVAEVLGTDIDGARAWLAGEGEALARPAPAAATFDVAPWRPREFRLPPGVVVAPLEEWPRPARDYALQRGLEPWQVRRWGVGWAADGPLAGRIVFPKRNARGEAWGYSARTFVGDARRYLEPRPDEGADLDVVFGEQHWINRRAVAVCEGVLNALAVERARSDLMLAATSGSQLRPAHARKLARFDLVLCVSDPDAAGDKLAAAIESAVARHSEFRRARLPEGADAASMGRAHLEELLRCT